MNIIENAAEHTPKGGTIILGIPVWAGIFAPPIRTFIKENPNIHGKKLAVFTCFSGGGADKAIEKIHWYRKI